MSNGLFDFGTGVATNNPLTVISDAIASYRSLFGTRKVGDRIVPGEVDRAAQPLTSEWLAARTGADPESGAFIAGGLLSPKAGPAALKIITRAEKVPGATKKWKGIDNIERANIDDRYAKINTSIKDIPEDSFRRLGDIFEHDALYKMYPDAKKITVRPMSRALLDQQGHDTRAAYDKVNNVIFVNPNLTKNEQASSIIHELNHYVQREEKLLPGTNAVDAMSTAKALREEFMLASAQDPRRAARIARQTKDKYGVDLEAPERKIAQELYRRQQGEGDAFASQRAFQVQQRQQNVLNKEQYAAMPQIDPMYEQTKLLNKDTIFEDIFGYKMAPTNEVDLGVSGIKNVGESTKDKMMRRILPELY